MRVLRLIMFLSFMLLLQREAIHAQWQQTNGPYGGTISCFAVSGTNLFAGTYFGGVFLSTDNGTSWSAVNTGLPIIRVNALAVSGTNLFAGTPSGVYLSTNNGTSWTAVNNGLTYTSVNALAVSGTNLFAGILGGGVFLSTNNGTNWSAVNTGLTNTNVQAFAVSGTNLFAGTNGGGVFLSTDSGTSWKATSTGLPWKTSYVEAFAISGTNLFAGTYGGVLLSTNNGTSWTSVNIGLTNTYVHTLAVSGTNLFAGTDSGVFVSTNNGTSWTAVNNGLTYTSVNALAVSGTNLFAGTPSGVFLSTNNGTNWTAVNSGLTGAYVSAFTVIGTKLFAGTSDGVFLSTDSGTSWSPVNTGLTSIYVRALAVIGTNLFAGTNAGVFLSTNNGTSWSPVNNGLTNAYVIAFAVLGTNLFAGDYGVGVFLSTDSGASWSPVNTGLTNIYVQALAVIGTNLYAGTWGGGVFLSTNNGASWSPVNTGLTNGSVEVLAVSPDSSGNLFAGTYGSGVFLSTDSGTSWSAANTGIKYEIVNTLAVSGNNLFAGTSSGVFLSTNNSTSWTAINNGMGTSSVTALAASGTNLFAGAYGGGIWRRPLSEFVSTPPTISSFSPTYGPIGTTVTITGTHFNQTPSNDIVYFGATKAAVNSASATSLMVTVPSGATYAPITVTDLATGFTVYSSKQFNVTFPGGGSITSSSFADKIDDTTGIYPHGITISDIDVDGKPDVVVVNWVSNTLSVLRNTSISGVVAFATKVDYATEIFPSSLAIADIDGDGKSDVVVTNYNSNTISVFRNTSTMGSVSFASKVNYATGSYPIGIAIADIDGNGKPDVVVTNGEDSTISVFRNTSTMGSISFASRVNYKTGSRPVDVAITDIDGDEKPDIAVINEFDNTLSIFLNTSTSGSISLASKVDYTTGSDPLGIAIGDIDGDGKHDVVVTNFGSNTISVFRNTSTSGSVSLASKIDYTAGNAPYGIATTDIDGDGKPDIVVTNFGGNTVSVLRNTSTSGSVSLASKVDYTTGNSPIDIAITDINGDGKPDLVTANYGSNIISLLRNTVGTVGVESDGQTLPTHFSLMQNYPNPFNPTTTINYQLPSRSHVTLKVFDILGRDVATLVAEEKAPGRYTATWNAADLAGGVYFYKMSAGSFSETKKLILLR
ncbi:MAG: FG-GAP-like repeat-containing protein [Bacteroidota bacterium]